MVDARGEFTTRSNEFPLTLEGTTTGMVTEAKAPPNPCGAPIGSLPSI
jgi:hypothetical protein